MTAVARFHLAARSAVMGRAYGDPVLMLAAVRLMRGVETVRDAPDTARLTDWAPRAIAGPIEDARPIETILLADVRLRSGAEGALVDALLRRLDERVPNAGRLMLWSAEVPARKAFRITVSAVEVSLAGDGAAPLDLMVFRRKNGLTDEAALPTCAYVATDDIVSGQDLEVQVRNPGDRASRFLLAWAP